MEKTEFGDLTLITSRENDKTVLSWEGESNERNPDETLAPYLENFISTLNGSLIIKFNSLYFMNSSTVYPIITFLTKLNENKINTEVHYSESSAWQKTSFKAMNALADILTHIKFIGD